jgi:hypothetical protein
MIQLARHLPFVGIIQIRFNGYVLSLTAPLRDITKVIVSDAISTNTLKKIDNLKIF